MNRCCMSIGLCLLAQLVLFPCGPLAAQSVPDAVSQKYQSDLERFAKEQELGSASPGEVVFYGSSSLRLWNLEQSFPEQNFVNRGFGGSNANEANALFQTVIVPLQPRLIVYYEGDNDLSQGLTPSEVAADVHRFVALVERHLPETRVIVISIKPSRSRWKLIGQQREANRKLEAICALNPQLRYLDLAACLLADDGTPNDSLFIDDQLHLSAAGYQIWTERLNEVLREFDRRPTVLSNARSQTSR